MKTIAVQDVLCPRCHTKLGENLVGTITLKCHGCKAIVVIDNTKADVIRT